MISVKEPDAHPKSHLFLTTVLTDMDISVADWIHHQLSSNGILLPKREVIPPGISRDEYTRLITEMMEESKVVAKIVALEKAGYDVKATGEGARIQSFLPGTLAKGILLEGDVVVAAEGQLIQTATDLQNLVRRQKPGTVVTLKVKRSEDLLEARVPTKESDSEPGIAVIGVLIKTYNFGHNLPLQIEIDSHNIGGPSAGLMFALGIIDSLDKEGLAAGRKIAGTGTISLNGAVGPVGGVAQKVVGAEESGAEYFLAPGDNVEAAKSGAKKLQVIRVDTIDDAIGFLRSLKPAGSNQRMPLFAPYPAPLSPAA